MRFAYLKTHHGFERLRLRGLSGARDGFHLAAIAQNPKTLALQTREGEADLAPCGALRALEDTPRLRAVAGSLIRIVDVLLGQFGSGAYIIHPLSLSSGRHAADKALALHVHRLFPRQNGIGKARQLLPGREASVAIVQVCADPLLRADEILSFRQTICFSVRVTP